MILIIMMIMMMLLMMMIFCRVIFVLMRREKRAECFPLLGPTLKTVGFSSKHWADDDEVEDEDDYNDCGWVSGWQAIQLVFISREKVSLVAAMDCPAQPLSSLCALSTNYIAYFLVFILDDAQCTIMKSQGQETPLILGDSPFDSSSEKYIQKNLWTLIKTSA